MIKNKLRLYYLDNDFYIIRYNFNKSTEELWMNGMPYGRHSINQFNKWVRDGILAHPFCWASYLLIRNLNLKFLMIILVSRFLWNSVRTFRLPSRPLTKSIHFKLFTFTSTQVEEMHKKMKVTNQTTTYKIAFVFTTHTNSWLKAKSSIQHSNGIHN